MRKAVRCIFFLLFLSMALFFVWMEKQPYQIEKIEFLSYDAQKEEVTIKLLKKNTFFQNDYVCIAEEIDSNSKIIQKGMLDTCNFILPIDKEYTFYIKQGNRIGNKITGYQKLLEERKIQLPEKTLYMVVGEEKDISSYLDFPVQLSSTSDHLTVDGSKITAKRKGEAYLYNSSFLSKWKIVITDLIELANLKEQKKETIPCNRYTEEENNLLDALLAQRVEEAGYQTRAGVVAAARFLTLEFPYQIPYFYENGRLHSSGTNYVDGEGRYYHKGLYLNSSKFQEIEKRISGPSTWGCPLTNWEDAKELGYVRGTLKPNGLDCSGFVSWVLYNGGFDPGDIGAGESSYPYQLTDLGEHTPLSSTLINSGKIKVGDLFNIWGHISILVGIDENNFYIAESLAPYGGVVVRTYSKKTVSNTFPYVVLMDSYYKENGNYTEFW